MKNAKNYKNLFLMLSLAIIFAIAFGGCGSSGGMYNKSGSMSADREYYGGADSYDYDGAYKNETAMYNDAANTSYSMISADNSAAANIPAERKIIRDANVTVEVENVEKSYENILARLAEFGGYKANDSMENYGENNIRIEATLKIPYKKLDDFITELKKEGNVKNSSTTSKDITDQYYDAEIRLETLEKTLENYFRFLENAKNVEEQLQVTAYINDVTYQIEQIKGCLNLWKSLVDYSTVTLYLYEPYQAPAEVRELKWDSLSLEDMGWFISSGFLTVCNGIFKIILWIIIGILVASPIFIPTAIVLFFVIRRYKRKQKERILYYQNMQNMQNPQNIGVNPVVNPADTGDKKG